jgi:nifR3 family TIM-barrel protein
MNRGFWEKLEKPIFALAPMANVTDAAFRHMIAKYGKPDVFFTEFVSVDGLLSVGKDKLLVDFWYEQDEHPIVAQIFGSKPEHFFKVAKMVKELGFDGVDINMGCPVKKVLNQQSCSALIRTPALAQEIIHATKEGAEGLPVSVKTRIGFSKVEIDTWIPTILDCDVAALTVHLRTVKEMSKVPAHWELMPEIVKIVDHKTLLLGNGDVMNLKEANEKVKETGCDGIMIGRGIFGNPWLFKGQSDVTIKERLRVMVEHTKLFEKRFVGIPIGAKSLEVMKKHYKAYVNGFDGAKELRTKLMEVKDSQEVERIVEEFTQSVMIAPAINK